MAATVLAALLAGGGTGLGLHAWKPDPLAAATGRANGGDSARASADPSGDRSTSATPSANPSASPSASPSTSPSSESAEPSSTPSSTPSGSPSATRSQAPAFTQQALLQPGDFTSHGWKTARVTASHDGLPGGAVTPCAELTMGDTGVVEGYAADYTSDHTTATELVARFDTTAHATKAFSQMLNLVSNCDSSAYEPKADRHGFSRNVEADGVKAIRWYNISGPGPSSLGIIGLIQAQERVAYVTVNSDDSDPDDTRDGGTTDIAALLAVAGKRLI